VELVQSQWSEIAMKRSVELVMLTTCAYVGCFVLSGSAGVRVLPETPGATSTLGELLSNGGFEIPAVDSGTHSALHPDGWLTFTSGKSDLVLVSNAAAHSGSQSIKFVSQATPEFYQGLFQTLPVTPGVIYDFTAYVISDPSSPLRGSGFGQLSIEWYDAKGTEIGGRRWGSAWNASLSSKEWTRVELEAVPPPDCARAHFVIVEKGGAQPVDGCAFFVDDVSVAKAQ